MRPMRKISLLLSIYTISWACMAGQNNSVHLLCNLTDHRQMPSVDELWLNESENTISFWNPELKFPAVFTELKVIGGYSLKENGTIVSYEINRQSGDVNVYMSKEDFSGKALYQSGSCAPASAGSRKF